MYLGANRSQQILEFPPWKSNSTKSTCNWRNSLATKIYVVPSLLFALLITMHILALFIRHKTPNAPHVISEKQAKLVKIFRPLKIISRKKKDGSATVAKKALAPRYNHQFVSKRWLSKGWFYSPSWNISELIFSTPISDLQAVLNHPKQALWRRSPYLQSWISTVVVSFPITHRRSMHLRSRIPRQQI